MTGGAGAGVLGIDVGGTKIAAGIVDPATGAILRARDHCDRGGTRRRRRSRGYAGAGQATGRGCRPPGHRGSASACRSWWTTPAASAAPTTSTGPISRSASACRHWPRRRSNPMSARRRGPKRDSAPARDDASSPMSPSARASATAWSSTVGRMRVPTASPSTSPRARFMSPAKPAGTSMRRSSRRSRPDRRSAPPMPGARVAASAALPTCWPRQLPVTQSPATSVTAAARQLGPLVALIVNMLDPEAIVLGGGLGLAAGVYREALIARHAPTSGPAPAAACRSCRPPSASMPASSAQRWPPANEGDSNGLFLYFGEKCTKGRSELTSALLPGDADTAIFRLVKRPILR